MKDKRNEYVPINIIKQEPIKPILSDEKTEEADEEVEVALEDITTEDPVQEQERQEDTNDDDESSEEKEEVVTRKKEYKPVKDKQQEKRQERPSRAKQRIKQLHSENKEKDEIILKKEQEIFELRQKLSNDYKTSKSTMKETLEKNLANLTKNLKQAMEDGDTDESIRIQDELITSKMQLAALTAELNNISVKEEQEKTQQKQKPAQKTEQIDLSEVPDKALDWIDENPAFHPENKEFDATFHRMAVLISRDLLEEGFKDDEDYFYEELNSRLQPRFPELFGMDEKNSVNYKNKTNTSNQDEDGKQNSDDNNEVEETRSKQYIEQTVSGASRTPIHQKGKKGRGKDSVVLDQLSVAHANRWGLSLEQIARRLAHQEKNRRDDGYVPIHITKQ